jgi:hydrogenase maturation protease
MSYKTTVVVIGYGNELRGDDSVGCLAAEEVSRWNLPHVDVYREQQLTPELADRLSSAQVVVFIDASLRAEAGSVSVTKISPDPRAISSGHVLDPETLLALVNKLYKTNPEFWLVEIPARSFNFGEALSSVAADGLKKALIVVRQLIQPYVATQRRQFSAR